MDSTTAATLAAIITGGLSLVGVILSNRAASSWMQEPLERLTCKVVASFATDLAKCCISFSSLFVF